MRTEIDATDYLGNQKKMAELAQRRPTSKPSDLVGPGIAASAVRITDFNDALATYDGYYSALSTALHAPTSAENFVGHVVMDDTLGGVQVFTGMTTHKEYTRVFRRLAGDAQTIDWSSGWTTPTLVQPYAAGDGVITAVAGLASGVYLTPPTLTTLGDSSAFVRITSGTKGINIAKTGVYTGYIMLNGTGSSVTVDVYTPDAASFRQDTLLFQNLYDNYPQWRPITFHTTVTNRIIGVSMSNQINTPFNASWDLQITRIGDVS